MSKNLFGDELRKLRQDAQLNLADVAEAAGCSIVYVSQVERGIKPPFTRDKLVAVLRRLGCPGRLKELLNVAARTGITRAAVQIDLRGKTQEETQMLTLLARRAQDGAISPDVAEQIRKLLEDL